MTTDSWFSLLCRRPVSRTQIPASVTQPHKFNHYISIAANTGGGDYKRCNFDASKFALTVKKSMTCYKRRQIWNFFYKGTSVKTRNKTPNSLAELWKDAECLCQEDRLFLLFFLTKIQNHIKQLHYKTSIVNDVQRVVNTKRAELGRIFRCLLLLLLSFIPP